MQPKADRDPTHLIRVERRHKYVRKDDWGNKVTEWLNPYTNDIKFVGTHVEAVDVAAVMMGKENVRSVSIITVGV